MEVLKITNLHKSFQEVKVLKGINLTLKKGEILSILGESGCGKSSLLGAIAGFFKIDDGEIYVENELLSSKDVFVNAQNRDVGILFQDYALFPHLSVMQNICFGISKLSQNEQNKRLNEVLDILNIKDLLKRYPNELSGGQAQRVALARTIVLRPKIILFDEPFSNLNHTLSIKMRKEIKNILKNYQLSAIFVTHDKDDAFYLSDKIALIKDGKILDFGTPKELYFNPKDAIGASFLGEINYLDIQTINSKKLKEFLSQKKGILRPKDLFIVNETTQITARVENCIFYGDYYDINLNLDGNLINIYHHSELNIGERVNLELKIC